MLVSGSRSFDLAFPLRYTPDGIVTFRSRGSSAGVGRPFKSACAKYAVICHLVLFELLGSLIQAEYACLTRPMGCPPAREKCEWGDERDCPCGDESMNL